MAERSLFFIALLFCGLALGPALAHLLELPNKLGLPRETYFAVQAIYAGWSLLGLVVFGALLSCLALAWRLRRQPRPRGWALVAAGCILATQALFWSFTYPANAATDNWTRAPDDWEALRQQWEWSHAAAAVFNLGALAALAASLLAKLAVAERRAA